MNPTCSNTQLGHLQLQKLSVCACGRTSVPFPKHSRRLYVVPLNPFGEIGGKHSQRHVISGVLGPAVSQRYKVYFD